MNSDVDKHMLNQNTFNAKAYFGVNDMTLAKAKGIKLLVLDVDGVLSDGKIPFTNTGDELKNFCVKDGLGIKGLHQYGIKTAIITGRKSDIVARRGKELGAIHIMQGRSDKGRALDEMCQTLGILVSDCAYVGDDLIDIAAIKKVKFGASVANGADWTKQAADYISCKNGGDGAVRQICELILYANGHYWHWLQSFGAIIS